MGLGASMKRLFIGNLARETTEEDLAALFSDFGPLHSLKIVRDLRSGESRGFGFVELEDGLAEKALTVVQGSELDGRVLTVQTAKAADATTLRPEQLSPSRSERLQVVRRHKRSRRGQNSHHQDPI